MNNPPIIVYFIYGCPHCKRAIQFLKKNGIPHRNVNLGSNAALAHKLHQETGWPTVPKIYVNGSFIGGADQLMEMAQNGELQRQLG